MILLYRGIFVKIAYHICFIDVLTGNSLVIIIGCTMIFPRKEDKGW